MIVAWYLLLVVAGFAAGVVNSIAGGGSFLTLPVLMFGMDPQLANGTNRLAVLLSSASAVSTFNKHQLLDRKLAFRLTVPTLLGAPIGVLLAVYLPAESFKGIFGFVFLAMAVILIMNPKRLLEEREMTDQPHRGWFMLFFGIGVYVGFIQAGMGILLLIGMSRLNTGDLVASNAIKNVIGFVVTLAATLLFILNGLVDWWPGLAMAAGNLMGGFVGAKLAIQKGSRLVFGFLVVVMLATGIKLVASSFMG